MLSLEIWARPGEPQRAGRVRSRYSVVQLHLWVSSLWLLSSLGGQVPPLGKIACPLRLLSPALHALWCMETDRSFHLPTLPATVRRGHRAAGSGAPAQPAPGQDQRRGGGRRGRRRRGLPRRQGQLEVRWWRMVRGGGREQPRGALVKGGMERQGLAHPGYA